MSPSLFLIIKNSNKLSKTINQMTVGKLSLKKLQLMDVDHFEEGNSLTALQIWENARPRLY